MTKKNAFLYCYIDLDSDEILKFCVKRCLDDEILMRTNSFSEAHSIEEKFNTAFIMGVETGKTISSIKRNP